MDFDEPLLLSEGVWSQLNIIQFHPGVEIKTLKERQGATAAISDERLNELKDRPVEPATVPIITVKMAQSSLLPPSHSALVQVEVKKVYHYLHSRCQSQALLFLMSLGWNCWVQLSKSLELQKPR